MVSGRFHAGFLAVFMGRSSNAVAFCLVLVARLALAPVDSLELLARNAQQAGALLGMGLRMSYPLVN